MKKTVTYKVRITVDQWATLQVLSCYGVNVSQFIRQSISEKIKQDWPDIKATKEKGYIPF